MYCLNAPRVITNKKEYEEAEAIALNYQLTNYIITPIFNGKNEAFFKEYVFIDKEDIFALPLSMKRIFGNQAVNAKFFGNLYILPNQDVKANLNTKVLDNLKQESLLNLIHKELVNNTAWRNTRTQKPCNKCLYQYICPSPSNYEYAMQRSTMCKLA